MANIRLVTASGQAPYSSSDEVTRGVAGDRMGHLWTADWLQHMVQAGKCFGIQVGALTTPIQGGGAGTIIDLDQPEVNIGVPSGRVLLPFRIDVQCEVPADQDGDVQEIIVGFDRLATNAGGTFTDEVAFNLRTDNPATSLCDPNSAYTADQTTAPTVIELARAQMVTNIVTSGITQGILQLLYEPKVVPMLVGPAQLLVYWGGTQAMSGFAQVFWCELPEEALGV